MSEKYISVDNLLQWIGERITCEALCSNSMKSDKGCDGNCILGEITPREKSIISVITESIKNAPTAPVEPVVRGEWIEHYDECECPVCGETWNYCDNDTERFDCCPKCGARLVEHGKERKR